MGRAGSCELWMDPAGQTWEDFVHDTDELLMVVEGTLEVELRGKILRPSLGEEVVIPRGAMPSVRNVGGTTARWLFGYN
jgi:mannose-6-phosphate isomerase-like protein (cupin superfamily)